MALTAHQKARKKKNRKAKQKEVQAANAKSTTDGPSSEEPALETAMIEQEAQPSEEAENNQPPATLPPAPADHYQLPGLLTLSEYVQFYDNNGTQQFAVRPASTAKSIWKISPSRAQPDRFQAIFKTLLDLLAPGFLKCDVSEDILKAAFLYDLHCLCDNGTSHESEKTWGLNMITYSQNILINPRLHTRYDYSMLSLHSLNGMFVVRFVDLECPPLPQQRSTMRIEQALLQLTRGKFDHTYRVSDELHDYGDGSKDFGRFYGMVKVWNRVMNQENCNILRCNKNDEEALHQEAVSGKNNPNQVVEDASITRFRAQIVHFEKLKAAAEAFATTSPAISTRSDALPAISTPCSPTPATPTSTTAISATPAAFKPLIKPNPPINNDGPSPGPLFVIATTHRVPQQDINAIPLGNTKHYVGRDKKYELEQKAKHEPEQAIQLWAVHEMKHEFEQAIQLWAEHEMKHELEHEAQQVLKGKIRLPEAGDHDIEGYLEQDSGINSDILKAKINRVVEAFWEALADLVLPMLDFYDPAVEGGYHDHI